MRQLMRCAYTTALCLHHRAVPTPPRCAHRCAVPTAAMCPPVRCAHHFPVPQLRSVTTARSLPFRCAHHCTLVHSAHHFTHVTVPTTALCRPPMPCPPLLLFQDYEHAYHCIICQSLLVDRTFVEHLPGAVVFSK